VQRVTRGGIGRRRRGGSLLKLEWVGTLCMEGNNAFIGRASCCREPEMRWLGAASGRQRQRCRRADGRVGGLAGWRVGG
jgi:hypothetical protein